MQELATCDPTFYKHTQKIFLLLHEAGLAYQAESMVNYDPVDKTVLANEQVDANGNSWRSGAKVEKKMLKQWFLKISDFRQQLLDDLSHLEGAWPERVLAMQKNWLGKSTGARIKFPIVAYKHETHTDIEVFTTRPDTLFGVQYVALAATHPLVKSLAASDVELQAFLDTLPALPPDSKVGYLLPHVRVMNPLASEESIPDATKATLPIYVAPYVLGDYGGGAVMGVPGHDVRDHSFWKHNRYDDPVRYVVSQSPDEATVALEDNKPFVHHGHLTKHSGPFAGMHSKDASEKIVSLLEAKGLGSAAETWKLRDWLVSRQRYWGTPIPIIHCGTCGPVPVPDERLPVELPSVKEHWVGGKTGNPLDHASDWVNTSCPKCDGAAKRETDTMDTFMDSSWYFMRYLDSKNPAMLVSPELANANLPVDLYIGGNEHAILHLLYARFISKFLATTSTWPDGAKIHGEPFKQLMTQGMVLGKTYTDPSNGRFLKPAEVDLRNPAQPIVVATNNIARVSYEKMSKSKFNGVDPGTCISKYGADAIRAHILFQAPVTEVLEWDEDKILGITRWLRRLHDFISQHRHAWLFEQSLSHGPLNTPKGYLLQLPESEDMLRDKLHDVSEGMVTEFTGLINKPNEKSLADDSKLWRAVQKTLMSVTESYSKTYALNTVVSDLMALTNEIIDHANTDEGWKSTDPTHVASLDEKYRRGHSHYVVNLGAVKELLKMMAPITPAFAQECWSMLHFEETIKERVWIKVMSRYKAYRNLSSENPKSILDAPWSRPDGTYEILAPNTRPVAVQVNGKLKFVVEMSIPKEGLTVGELERWAIEEILKTDEGRRRMVGKMDPERAKRVIVVKGGATVNFVMPK